MRFEGGKIIKDGMSVGEIGDVAIWLAVILINQPDNRF